MTEATREAIVRRLALLPPDIRRALAATATRGRGPSVRLPEIVVINPDGSREVLPFPPATRETA